MQTALSVRRSEARASDTCRRLSRFDERDRIGALAIRRPEHGLVAARPARNDINVIGHHESRVEADPELTDELRALNSLCGLHSVHESLSAGACDGAEALDHLLPTHPDAVILDGQPAVLAIGDQGDPRFRI